jgi:hypothetical protein
VPKARRVPARCLAVVAPMALGLLGAACSDPPERSQTEYCRLVVEHKAELQPPSDAALDSVYATAAEAFDQLEPTAPPEIRADVTRTTQALHQLADLSADAANDPAGADSRALVALAAEVKASTDKVNAYNRDRCGVDTSAATNP